jgi:hypothetical protein
MHIEHGVVEGAKILLTVATAVGSVGLMGKMALETVKNDGGVSALAARALASTMAVFVFFQVLPHFPAGVSEVHFILGSTLFLLFGGGAASIGLAAGLLIQGVFFAPFDLPQYGMNVTTLIVPLWAVNAVARNIIAPNTAYVDLTYKQTLALSTAFQGGVVAWVTFWAVYGQGMGAENLASVATFGAAYMTVVLIEPIIDLAVLFAVKSARAAKSSPLFNARLHGAA